MSKKNDLKLVFDFIAEYLKEDEVKKVTENPKLESRLLLSETPTAPKTTTEFDVSHIKNIMNRIEEKDKEKAKLTNILSKQENDFKEQIKKIQEDSLKMLEEQKTKEEKLPVSATTTNTIYKAEGDGLGLIKDFLENNVSEIEQVTDTPKKKKK